MRLSFVIGKGEIILNGNNEQHKNNVFIIRLLFKDQPKFPEINIVDEIVGEYLGSIEIQSKTQNYYSYTLKDYCVNFENEEINPILTIFSPVKFENNNIEEQLIDENYGYQVIVMDVMTNLLNPKERIIFTMNLIEMLAHIFTECEAIYFENWGKMFLIGNSKDKIEMKEFASKKIMF